MKLSGRKKKNLIILGTNNAMELDLLAAGGCIKEVHSHYEEVGNKIPANTLEVEKDQGNLTLIQHSKNVLLEQFRAGAADIEFTPVHKSGIEEKNDYTRKLISPFSGEEYIVLKSVQPDVAIIHAHKADQYGNVQLDPDRMFEDDSDILIAKSAKFTIVTVEQIVSEAAILDDPAHTMLSASVVDAVVELPYGAHPFSCDNRYQQDNKHLEYYCSISENRENTNKYLEDYILETANWNEYLNKIGIARLLHLSSGQEVLSFDENNYTTTI